MLARIGSKIKSVLPGRRNHEQVCRGQEEERLSGSWLQSRTSTSALLKFSKESHLKSMQSTQQTKEQVGELTESIIEKIEFCEVYLRNHQNLINNVLRPINLNGTVFIQEFQHIRMQIKNFTSSINEEEYQTLRFKKQLLSELRNLIIKLSSVEGTFNKIMSLIELELKMRMALTMFKEINGQKDITNSVPESYQEVYSQIIVVTPPNPSQIHQNYNTMKKIFHILAGAMVRALPYSSKIVQKMVLGYNLILNAINPNRSLLQSLSFYRHPSLGPVADFYNLFEDGFLGFLTGLGFPKIQTNTFIYVPLSTQEDSEKKDIFKQQTNAIKVRVLYHKPLPLHNKKDDQWIDSIIIHMHGGGYAVHSSRSSQGFTRKWANQLKIPIFSIDYKMAPEYTHPQSAFDCLKVYSFLVDHLHQYLKIRPKNIYLAGDSSGGNLVCSLTTLILKEKLVSPKGLFLVYPGLDFRSIYYPSRRFIFNDPMIWPTVAELFVESYFPTQEDKKDPLASPILLTEEYVSGRKGDKRFPLAWPPTAMMLGDEDLIRDECLLFMQRLYQSKIPSRCLLYEHLGHGFLVTEGLIKYSTTTIKHSIALFKDLMDGSWRADIDEK